VPEKMIFPLSEYTALSTVVISTDAFSIMLTPFFPLIAIPYSSSLSLILIVILTLSFIVRLPLAPEEVIP